MDSTRLGASDLVVSRVGLGCNNFGRRLDLEGTRAVIDAAIDAGITFLDTADIYGTGDSERFIGETLAGRREPSSSRRSSATTCRARTATRPARLSRVHADARSTPRSGACGRDHIDLWYYHRPDGVTPLEETLGEMHELVVEGKVRWLGLSNVGTGALDTAAALAAARLEPGRRRAEPLQPPQPRGRRRRRARCRARDRLHPVLPARERASDREVPARRAHIRRARGSRGADDGRLSDERLARVEELEAFADPSWPHDPRARDRRPRLDPGRRVGDRGGDLGGAGARKCGRGQLAARRRRARRARRGLSLRRPGVGALDDGVADAELRGHPVELLPERLGARRVPLVAYQRTSAAVPAAFASSFSAAAGTTSSLRPSCSSTVPFLRLRDPAQRVDGAELAAHGGLRLGGAFAT